jgi:hypothetical protein
MIAMVMELGGNDVKYVLTQDMVDVEEKRRGEEGRKG